MCIRDRERMPIETRQSMIAAVPRCSMGDGVRFGTQARGAPIPQNQMKPMQATRRSTAENGEMSIPFPQSVPSATPSAPGATYAPAENASPGQWRREVTAPPTWNSALPNPSRITEGKGNAQASTPQATSPHPSTVKGRASSCLLYTSPWDSAHGR